VGGDYSAGYKVQIPKPRRYRKPALGFVVLSLVIVVAFLSSRPVMRLRATAPPEFSDIHPEWSADRRNVEERLAGAYWQCAVQVLQWKYSYGSALPEAPPSEFQIDTASLIEPIQIPADHRMRYWRRLQRVWASPQAWRESYEWNLDWATNLVSFLKRFRGGSRPIADSP
jgi:hypothetical protein